MIIGNNNSFTPNFDKKFQAIKNDSNNNKNSFSQNKNTNKYTNVTNKNEMADKSFNILQERYNNGLISLEEFKEKCNKLNKLRQ